MSLARFSLALAVMVLAVFVFSTPHASAAYSRTSKLNTPAVTPSEQKILDATVNLYCRIEVGNKKFSTTGSGVIIDPRGVILTNAHVAQYLLLNGKDSRLSAECAVRTGSPAREAYTADVLYVSTNWLTATTLKSAKTNTKGTGRYDFALLYITGATKGSLPAQFPSVPVQTSALLEEGDEVLIAGYPAGKLSFKDIRSKLVSATASSTIASVRGFETGTLDYIALSPSKLATTGVSGGPVLQNDSVIGLSTAMSSGSKKKEASLRAITVPYVNRLILSETGMPLPLLIAGDLSLRAALTKGSISADALKAIEKPLRNVRD